MGFKTQTERLRKFEVKHFGISHTSNEPLPNHVEALVFNPGKGVAETKYIEKYPGVEGRVIDIQWYQREDKNGQVYRGYELTMDIGDEVILLDVPFRQPPAKIYSLLVRHGENVDWSKPLEISAWKTTNKKDQDTIGVCFWQTDAEGKRVTVKSAHTIDHPNGCPAPEINELTGKPIWTQVERWLKFNFDEKVIPAVRKAAEGYTPAPKTIASSEVIAEYDDDTEDAYPVPEFAGNPSATSRRQDELDGAARHAARKQSQPDDPFEGVPPMEYADDSVPF